MKVRCVNPGQRNLNFNLTKNKTYKVLEKGDTYYKIIDDNGKEESYIKWRFEEVREDDIVMKVKCINASCPDLTKNKIYEVITKTDDGFYEIINDFNDKQHYLQERFKEIKMTYNKILMDFCTQKNNLVNNALAERKIHGVYYMVKEDFDEVKSWDEEICKEILECLGLGDMFLCPWCLKRDIEDKNCLICNYGKRHGNCVYDFKSTYRIIRNNFSFPNIKGMEELFNQTKEQYKLLVEQKKYTEKPNPIKMKQLNAYVVELKHDNSNDVVRKICMYLSGGGEEYVIWLSKNNGFDYVGEGDNKFSWNYGKITKIVTNVTEMLYDYGIETIEEEYDCEEEGE